MASLTVGTKGSTVCIKGDLTCQSLARTPAMTPARTHQVRNGISCGKGCSCQQMLLLSASTMGPRPSYPTLEPHEGGAHASGSPEGYRPLKEQELGRLLWVVGCSGQGTPPEEATSKVSFPQNTTDKGAPAPGAGRLRSLGRAPVSKDGGTGCCGTFEGRSDCRADDASRHSLRQEPCAVPSHPSAQRETAHDSLPGGAPNHCCQPSNIACSTRHAHYRLAH